MRRAAEVNLFMRYFFCFLVCCFLFSVRDAVRAGSAGGSHAIRGLKTKTGVFYISID